MDSRNRRERPPATRDIAALSRGTNQTGLRLYNERLVLSLIRRHGALPKAAIARLTGLSAQTISVIMKQLEADSLVRREPPLRGRVGQPSVPYSLNRDGACSVGIKIGRRSADLVLMDFIGEVRARHHVTYAYPTPESTLEFLREAFAAVSQSHRRDHAGPIAGLGVAIPSELWNWAEQVGAPEGVMDGWKLFDIEVAFGEVCGLPVYVCNDATAACGAELVFGGGAEIADFLYFFVGTFVGGGLVLDGSLYPGKRGNAGAVGSMLVAGQGGGVRGYEQLLQSASIFILEKRIIGLGLDPSRLWRPGYDWQDLGIVLDVWVDEVAHALAFAIIAGVSVIDLEHVVIDGAFPADVRRRLVERTRAALAGMVTTGLLPVSVGEGSIGDQARVLGAASLPLMANFIRDSELLFKDEAGAVSLAGR